MTAKKDHSQLPSVAEYRELVKNARILKFSEPIKGTYLDIIRYTGQVDLLNKLAGNSYVTYTYKKHEKGGTVNLASTKKGGISLRYVELPYEWNFPHWTWAELFPGQGPLSYIRLEYGFTEENHQTICHFTMRYTSRFFKFLGTLMAKQLFLTVHKALMKIEKTKQNNDLLAIEPFLEKEPNLLMGINEMKSMFKEFHPDSNLIDKITKFIAYAPEKHVSRIRPLHIAAHLKLSEMDLIEFFLRGTKKGIFDMSWDLLCPSCRGDKLKVNGLFNLKNHAYCDYCDLDFNASFSDNVELTFRPSGKIRKLSYHSYCVNSPANTPHIFAQANVWPDVPLQSEFIFQESSYKIGIIGADFHRKIFIDSEFGQEDVEMIIPDDLKKGEPLKIKPRTKFKFTNSYNSKYPVTIKFITEKYKDFALLASRVTSIQEFRDLFSSEALSPGMELGVENLTFMFTDLKDSTPMYEEMGDAKAFALVRDHFDLLTNEIRKNNGGVVKTIGDAVMAIFQNPKEAQYAGSQIILGMKKKFPHILVKIGIFSGPCIAVNSNDKLDYFGSTVNKAARIQGLSKGNDIVMARSMEDSFYFPSNQFSREVFRSQLKGIIGEVDLIRYTLLESALLK
jgi:adenylate cyclase